MNNSHLFLRLGVIAGFGILVYLLAPILTPFLVSVLIAYIGNPVVSRFQRMHVPRAASVVFLFIFFFVVLLVLVLGVVPLIQKQISTFAEKVPGYIDWLQARLASRGIGLFSLDVDTIKQQILQQWQDVGKWMGTALSFAKQSGVQLFNWLLNLALIPVVTFYLLRDWDDIVKRLKQLLPARLRARAAPLAEEIDDTLAGFLRGQLLVMVILAIIDSIGLALVGLDLALPIGLLAGLVSFIPYLGFIVGILVASLAALLQFQDGIHLLGVLGVFAVGQMMESMVLTPRLVGQRIGLHPVVVIFAVLAGGQLFGFLGILLALPVSAVLVVWLRHLHNGYKHHTLPKRSSRS